MRSIAGAITILAGAVLAAAGQLSNTMTTRGYSNETGMISLGAGMLLVVLGVGIFLIHLHEKN